MKSTLWIIIIIALVLIGYWIWSASDNNTTNTTTNTTTETQEEARTVTFNLGAQNNSGQSGTAVLTENNGTTQVVLTMTGTAYVLPQPAHIHVGACPTPGAITHPLTDVINGSSTTTINATLADLEASLPLAINVHKSAVETSVYTACGDLSL